MKVDIDFGKFKSDKVAYYECRIASNNLRYFVYLEFNDELTSEELHELLLKYPNSRPGGTNCSIQLPYHHLEITA